MFDKLAKLHIKNKLEEVIHEKEKEEEKKRLAQKKLESMTAMTNRKYKADLENFDESKYANINLEDLDLNVFEEDITK